MGAERSPKRKGYHLWVPGVDAETARVAREMFDDPARVRFDLEETRLKPKDILFQVKWEGGRRYESELVDERHILAPPFFSRVPRSHYVGRKRRWSR